MSRTKTMHTGRLVVVAIIALSGSMAFTSWGKSLPLMAELSQEGGSSDNVMRAGVWDTTTIPATVDVRPDLIHLTGGGHDAPGLDIDDLPLKDNWWKRWVLAFVELPPSQDVEEILVETVTLSLPGVGSVEAQTEPTHVGDFDDDGVPDLMVAFKRSEVRHLLSDELGLVTLEVSGELGTSTPFSGTDTVAVIAQHPVDDDDGDPDDDDGDPDDDDGDPDDDDGDPDDDDGDPDDDGGDPDDDDGDPDDD